MSGAECRAYSKLSAALCAASQQKVRNVDRRDEEHQNHRSEDRQQRRLHIAGYVIMQGSHDYASRNSSGAFESLRVRLSERRQERIEFTFCLFLRYAGLQARNHAQMMSPFS